MSLPIRLTKNAFALASLVLSLVPFAVAPGVAHALTGSAPAAAKSAPAAPSRAPKDMIFKLANGGERCFGAIGNSCSDQAKEKSIPNLDYNRVGIKPDYTVTAAVSVGSILHDNCCRSNHNGLYCTGINWGSVFTDLGSNLGDLPAAIFNLQRSKGGDGVACAKEWRKAVYDTLERRFWYEKFGPYRDDEKADDDHIVSARAAKLPGRFGVRDSVTPYTGVERGETSRLKAPAGTKLEVYDKAFCASGSFREEGWCAAGMLCSGSAELERARQEVRNWEDWRNRKLKEAEKFWPVDPRRAAIMAEIGVAEGDHAAKTANVARLETIFNNRNQHWGICR